MKPIYLTSILLVFIVLFSNSNYQISLGQDYVDNSVTTESVTSIKDAILKSILIITQVIAFGATFNHLFFKWNLNKKSNTMIYSNQTYVSYFNSNVVKKRYIYLIIFSCILISIFSSSIMLLQSAELSNNLDLDFSTAFSILYSTPVGNVWILRIISSVLVIGLTILFYRLVITQYTPNKETKKQKDYSKSTTNNRNNMFQSLEKIFLIIILVIISINLFSNSMVSHSNSLQSFSSLAVSVDWIHLMAVAVWIGGLFYISIVITRMFKDDDKGNKRYQKIGSDINPNINYYTNILVADNLTLTKFSFIAIISLCIIGITGLYLGYLHIQNFSALLNTLYGQLLILKVGITFPLILMGRWNQIKLHENIELLSKLSLSEEVKSDTDLDNDINTHYFDKFHRKNKGTFFYNNIKRSLVIELFIGLSVLVVASVLSVTSPPSLDTLADTNVDQINNNKEKFFFLENSYLFMFVTITLSLIIFIAAIINYRKRQKQIKILISKIRQNSFTYKK